MGYQLCCNAETIVHHCLHGPQTDVVMGQGCCEGTDKEYYGEENLVIVAAELGQGRERHIHRNKSLYIGCFLLDGLLRGFMLHTAQLSLLAEGFPDGSFVYFFRSEHAAKRVISGFLLFLGDDFLDFRFDIDIDKIRF